MKGIRVTVLVALCTFAFTFSAYAQSGKIGVLDLSRTFDDYQKTKEFDVVLEEKSGVFKKERDAKVDELKEMQGKLSLLKEDEKEKLEKEFEQKREEFLEYDQAKKTDLGKQRDEKIRDILLEIEKTVSEYAEKEKYDVILNDRVLIYGDPALDITDNILKILNENYNKK